MLTAKFLTDYKSKDEIHIPTIVDVFSSRINLRKRQKRSLNLSRDRIIWVQNLVDENSGSSKLVLTFKMYKIGHSSGSSSIQKS